MSEDLYVGMRVLSEDEISNPTYRAVYDTVRMIQEVIQDKEEMHIYLYALIYNLLMVSKMLPSDIIKATGFGVYAFEQTLSTVTKEQLEEMEELHEAKQAGETH